MAYFEIFMLRPHTASKKVKNEKMKKWKKKEEKSTGNYGDGLLHRKRT